MMPKPTTDVALVVLHRTAAGSLFVNPSSGIRIAAGGPDATSSRWIATAGLRRDVHRLQAAGGLVLLAVAAGSCACLRPTRLTGRCVPPRERIQAAMAQGGKRAAAGPLVMAGDCPASGCSRLLGLLRQAVHGRLAGHEDVNDAERFARNPVMRVIASREGGDRPAVSTSERGRFETGALRRATRSRFPSPAWT